MARTGAAARSAWPDDAVELGRIAGAYGVQGWLRLQPYSDDPRVLLEAPCWLLKPPDPAERHVRLPASLTILESRRHGEAVVARAAEVGDRDAAEALRGARVCVSRASFPAPQADEFYWHDLIGLAVVNRQGVALGTVAGLLDTGAHSVLRVAPPEGAARERLIPFVAAYIDDVKLSERRIEVDWQPDY